MTDTKTKQEATTTNKFRQMIQSQKKYQYNLGYVNALEVVQELIDEIIAYGPNTASNTTDILQKRINDLEIAKFEEDWFQ